MITENNTTTQIKAEFQIRQHNNNISTARIYYPEGFVASGSITNLFAGTKVHYDSAKVGSKIKGRVIGFSAPIATMVAIYESGVFAPCNLASYRKRTDNLIAQFKQELEIRAQEEQVIAVEEEQPVEVTPTPMLALPPARTPSTNDVAEGLKRLSKKALRKLANDYELGVKVSANKGQLSLAIAEHLVKTNPSGAARIVDDLNAQYRR